MQPVDAVLLRFHQLVRAQPLFYRLAIGTRLLLAAGFIPTGMVKLLGQRFTVISVETPVGMFFEAMYQGGIYWRFIGASQIVASVLLLIPATSAVGAVIFFPIILNIFLITVGYQFAGTPVVTGLMLLAATFLLAWEYQRIRLLFGADLPRAADVPLRVHRLGRVERAVYVIGGASGMLFFVGTRGFVPGPLPWGALLVAAICVLAAAGMAVHAQVRTRTGSAGMPPAVHRDAVEVAAGQT